MKPLEERTQRERERDDIIRRAVEAADRIIIDGSDGSVEETDFLTVRVAQVFLTKVNTSLTNKLLKKDMED